MPDVVSCCPLDIMTTKACATASLVNMHCCPRCVLRLLHGDSISSCRNVVINAKDAIRESPICPFCCGLLHHPSLCTLTEDCVPSGGIPNVLHSIVAKLRCSEYEFSACQIKVADPLALVIRDEIMLGVVLQSADSDVGQCTTECQVPSLKRDVKFSGQSKLPAKVVWRWIIESQLSSTLKVPFISSLQDLDSIQGHNLTFLATNSLLVIEIELAHSQSEQEGQLILEHACLAGPASIRAQALGLLNAKSKSKRTRYQRRAGHDDTSRPSTPSDELLSACRFSKTKLQLLFSALSNCASKVQFSLPSPTTIPFLADLKLGRLAPVILAGRYVKLSRRLPQTPWIVDNVRKLPSSVEELIVLPMKEIFGQSSIFTFTASGREDVDVRCLGLGRPFILKIENYEASIEKVICLYSEKHGNRGSKLDVTLSPSTDNQTLSNIDLLSLATLVNSRAGNKLFIRDLQIPLICYKRANENFLISIHSTVVDIPPTIRVKTGGQITISPLWFPPNCALCLFDAFSVMFQMTISNNSDSLPTNSSN